MNESQRYNEKLAARIGKYVKRMQRMIKPFMLDNSNSTMILNFLDLFKRSCDFNKMLGRNAAVNTSNITKKGLGASFNNLTVPI